MTTDRTVSFLLAELPGARLVRGNEAVAINGVEHDSRAVAAGSLFVAIPGFNVDGHDYVSSATERGASAVLVQDDRLAAATSLQDSVAVITVPDTRRALSRAAAWFYGYPSRQMRVIGVTGTDGKTTTCHMLTSILEAAGARVARLGTVDTLLPGVEGGRPTRMSTPEANQVQPDPASCPGRRLRPRHRRIDEPRTGAAPSRRRRIRRRGDHERHRRPPRLPQELRGIPRGEVAPLRGP